ncbi:MAG: histidine kinase [Betaproteobacteria bacterium]|nr:histidine kinase [Betaproteobacteria bacterium]
MARSINQNPRQNPRPDAARVAHAVKGGATQNAYGSALPNFRNLGILLRILLIVNAVALIAVIIKSPTLAGLGAPLMEVAALVQPLLILTLMVLYVCNNVLARLSYTTGAIAVIGITLLLTAALYFGVGGHFPIELSGLMRYWLLVGLVTAMLLCYFDLRGRALSPALSEARLQALQARIRPHFLFKEALNKSPIAL